MRRVVLPGLLGLIALGSVVGAWRTEAGASLPSEAPAAAPARVTTPVLSARRIPGLVQAAYGDRKLREGLDALVARSPSDTCLVVNVASQGQVFAHDPGNLQTPASVEKLLTAVATLDALGPDSTLQTTLVARRAPADGIVTGDLWLVGGGDPLLATSAYAQRFKRQPQIYTPFEGLADALAQAGVREIHGSIVGDDSRYDRDRSVKLWPSRFLTQHQSGPLSALLVNDGFVAFPPSPDVSTPSLEATTDPPLHAAQVLTQILAARGITVMGTAATGTAPEGAAEVAGISSRPMSEVVTEMLRESDNTTAELLVKELGRAKGAGGTTAAGVEVVRSTLAARQLVGEGTVIVDGSGLASENQVTCSTVLALLDQAGAGSPLASGLAVAGESGTLAERFEGSMAVGRLRAKTGTLSRALSLAGFVDALSGSQLSFSYLMNVPEPQQVGRSEEALQEELGSLLARYPDAPPLEALGPQPAAAGAADGAGAGASASAAGG